MLKQSEPLNQCFLFCFDSLGSMFRCVQFSFPCVHLVQPCSPGVATPLVSTLSFVVRLSVVFTSLAYMLPGFHILVILCLGFHHILSMFFVP